MHLISDTQPQVSHDNIQKRAMNFKNKYTPAPPSPTGEKNKRNKKKEKQTNRFKLFCLKESRMKDHNKSFQTHRTMPQSRRVYQIFKSTSDRKRNNAFSFL